MTTPSPAIRARGAIKAAGGLLGTKEAAERLRVKPTNVGAVRGLSPVAENASGPSYLGCEVDEAVERLELARARRAASAAPLGFTGAISAQDARDALHGGATLQTTRSQEER